VTERAPAKINLCLFVGPTRADGRHELVSVMQSLEWGDEVSLEPAARDEVVCAEVDGPNLAAAALAAFRSATGALREPHRLAIEKRIPVAAGLGGGSGDAAAVLRLAARAAEGDVADDGLLLELAGGLGADVPAQVQPGRALAAAAGERVRRLAPPPRFGVLVLPARETLSTAAVYAEADRLGVPRDADSLAERLWAVEESLGAERNDPFGMAGELLVNDLEPAARSLCPAIEDAFAEALAAGADHVMVAGSGPTVFGLFAAPAAAERAAGELASRDPAPVATTPLESL